MNEFDADPGFPWSFAPETRFGSLLKPAHSIEELLADAGILGDSVLDDSNAAPGQLVPIDSPTTSDEEYPHCIAIPEGFERRYAYPLIVWFHDEGECEQDFLSTLPRISERNYVGLSIRGNRVRNQGYGWDSTGDTFESVMNSVRELVQQLRCEICINDRRIFVGGAGAGGTAALKMFLTNPAMFRGVMGLHCQFPKADFPLIQFREVRGKRILLTGCASSRDGLVGEMVEAGRMLYSAGASVGTRVYANSGDDRQFRDLDRWMMSDIDSAVGV